MPSPTPQSIALVGVGEMGAVFARAFLRAGHPVHPVTRSQRMEDVAAREPDPALALVTVGEADLHDVMSAIPSSWRTRTGLIQNELLPRDWIAAGIEDPTVAVVWFEKKPGQDVKVIIPTPVGGPRAGLVADALAGIGIPTTPADDPEALEDALVEKNLYILTANIGGLVSGGSVSHLWENHNSLARDVAAEVLMIQEWLVGRALDGEALLAGMLAAFDADPDHGATGRSAPSRLVRALDHAAAAGIDVPVLERIRQARMLDA